MRGSTIALTAASVVLGSLTGFVTARPPVVCTTVIQVWSPESRASVARVFARDDGEIAATSWGAFIVSVDAYRASLTRARDIACSRPDRSQMASELACLEAKRIEVAAALGASGAARALAMAADHFARLSPATCLGEPTTDLSRGQTTELSALRAVGRGALATAAEEADTAAGIYERSGDRLSAQRTRRLAGRALLEGGDVTQAGLRFTDTESALERGHLAVTVRDGPRALENFELAKNDSEPLRAAHAAAAWAVQSSDPTAGLQALERAMTTIEEIEGPDNPRYARLLQRRAWMQQKLRHHGPAQRDHRTALKLLREAHGAEHARIAEGLLALGWAELETDAAEDAAERFEEALRIRDADAADLVGRAEVRFALSRALRQAGEDRARSKRLAEEAAQLLAGSPGIDPVLSAAIAKWMTR